MPIIGKLLKKTTEITYKRTFHKGKEYSLQFETLQKLLTKARKTAFGKKYEFQKSIDNSADAIDIFQKNVPLTDYDAFFGDWLKATISGEKDHIWPGRIKYYALSSGTTSAASKRIPITPQTIRSFQKTSLKQISTLHSLDLPDSFFSGNILIVGGSSKLESKPTHIEGDLSGILKKYTSIVMAPFTKPNNKIAKIKDWNEKINSMVDKAPTWDIGVVAGVPSWCIMLIDRIIKKYELKSIHDIWPNFRVYVHGGVFVNPYRKKLESLFHDKVYMLDTYLSSEGYFAYQVSPEREGMRLLLDNGVFFEFIPFNSDYFDVNGDIKDQHKALTIHEVCENVDYALVISTNSGLWRYLIGDLIRFTNLEERELKITGRIKQFISLSGEHLSLDNINVALNEVSNQNDITIEEFCMFAHNEETKHVWYVGSNDVFDEQKFIENLDTKLSELNDDYKSVRKYTLKNPEIHVLPTQVFYDYMQSVGKLGSQYKFPRVLNESQIISWNEFLKKYSMKLAEA